MEEYAQYLTNRHIRRVKEIGNTPIPDKDEVYKVKNTPSANNYLTSNLLIHLSQQTKWALTSFYDNSSTLYHLHTKVRTSTDPQDLQYFLDNLPETVMRDMSVSAMAEEERQVKKRTDIVKLLDFVIKRHEQTAEATLHLLKRVGEDEEVEYVKALVGESLREVKGKRRECVDGRVLEKGDWVGR